MKPLVFVCAFLFLSCSLFANEKAVLETYGVKKLDQMPSFKGGYINFGCWEGINLQKKLSESDRVRASEQLYKLVFSELAMAQEGMKVLEVGCGLGNGCALLAQKMPTAKIFGVDITPMQIERARSRHSSGLKVGKNIDFKVGKASNTGFKDQFFDQIYSVEAAQYFPSMLHFAQEAYRILRPGGKLVVTAHFSTSNEGYEKVKQLLPTVAEGVDLIIPIEEVRAAFKQAGFRESKFYPIGNKVFKGFDKWISQVPDAPWARNIYKSYRNNFINYYVIALEREK